MMRISDFNYFKVGTVFNPIELDQRPEIIARKITIKYPARLNAMAIDPSKVTENNNMIYSPGEVVFSTEIFIEVTVELVQGEDSVVKIDGDYNEKSSVIHHTCLIMKKAFNYSGGFRVTINKYHKYRHCGLGSTGSLQASIGACINHLFNFPFKSNSLLKYLARNYGEEIDYNHELLNPVQCIGGSAASGLFNGGILVIAGENVVIAKGEVPDDYIVLIGIPKDFVIQDSVVQFEDEKQNLDKFNKTGSLYKNEIAYNILHKFLPSLVDKNLDKMGDVVFDYRYNMGSIKNCSYTYPKLVELMDSIAFLKTNKHVEILSISSVGPAVFCILNKISKEICIKTFEEHNLEIIETKIHNEKYCVKEIELV